MPEPRLIIDTKLWVSRLLLPDSVSARAVDAALRWGRPIASVETLAELSEVLARPKFDRHVSREDRQRFLLKLGGIVTLVPVTQNVHACRDPRDDKFLNVALAGKAGLILTGDQDLLALNPFHDVRILTPADFLREQGIL